MIDDATLRSSMGAASRSCIPPFLSFLVSMSPVVPAATMPQAAFVPLAVPGEPVVGLALPPVTAPDRRPDRGWARERWRDSQPLSQRVPVRVPVAEAAGVPRLTRVLVVSANPDLQEALRTLYEREGREVLSASQPTGLLEMIARAEVELVLCDLALPAGGGASLLAALRTAHPSLALASLDDPSTGSPAPDALSGVPSLRVPIVPAEAMALLQQAERRLADPVAGVPAPAFEPVVVADPPDGATVFRGMTGSTAVMREVFRMIARVGRTDVTVLVTGESGTGKELVARALHEESGRRHRPFVALNCSALPSELVESELFGHTRGAFTGAVKDRGGLFEAAHGGTLFLDEIGDLGAMAQAKVLRALENGEVMRVGGTRSTRVDVRVIAATNRPLDAMVADGRFREDLLYRLKVISLALPPLRDRLEDLPLLATRFLALFAARHGLPVRPVSEGAWAVLRAHSWPGNIRELRNVMESALVMCDGPEIDLCDLPASVTRRASALPADPLPDTGLPSITTLPFVEARERALREFDRAYLRAALARNGGNIARTARSLGLHRQSLQKLMARRDLRPDPRGMAAEV